MPVKISDLGARRRLAVTAGVLCLALTGCSSNDSSADPDRSPTVSVSGSETSAAVDDEAAVKAVVDKYWAVTIRSQNQGTLNPRMYAGIAEGPLVESHLRTLRHYKDIGMRRVGRPTLAPLKVEVNRGTATARRCWNEDRWGFKLTDQPAGYPPKSGSKPWQVTLERRGADWLITEAVKGKLKC
jgi:hypothetical protein